MNDNNNDTFINKIIIYINKFFYSPFFFLLLLVLGYILFNMYPNCLIGIVVFSIIAIIIHFFKCLYIGKNKSKYGILFIVNNSPLYISEIASLFNVIKSSLGPDYDVKIYYDNYLNKLFNICTIADSNDKKYLNKNIHMIIDLTVFTGKNNMEDITSVRRNFIKFLVPSSIPKEILTEVMNDLEISFVDKIDIHQNQSSKDIDNSSLIFEMFIKYVVGSINYLFGRYKDAIDVFNTMITRKSDIAYIKKMNINKYKRIADSYNAIISKILSEQKYLYNSVELDTFDRELNKLDQCSRYLTEYPTYLNILYDNKSFNYYAHGDLCKAMVSLDKHSNKNDFAYSLNKAYLLLLSKKYKKAIKIYRDASRRPDIDDKVVCDCLKFIASAMKSNLYNYKDMCIAEELIRYFFCHDDNLGVILNYVESVFNKSDYASIKYILVNAKSAGIKD